MTGTSRNSSMPTQRPAGTQTTSLPLNLYGHKKSIALQWSAIFIATCFLPQALYFGLRYGSHKKPDTALTPPTAILGVLSILTIGFRAFKLARKGSTKRPLGGKWWAMDYFEWNLIISFAGVTAVLIEATGEDPPNAIVLYIAGGQLFITAAMSAMGLPCPIRLSSTPAGFLTRPGVYVLVEDVCSIDGKGGQEFRKALQGRFGESPAFRRMIAQLNWFWAVGSMSVAIGVTVIIEVVDNMDVIYAIGWSIPWVWGLVGTIVTISWVRLTLKKERASQNPNV